MLAQPSDIPRNTREQSFELGRHFTVPNPGRYSKIDLLHQNIAVFDVGGDASSQGWFSSRIDGGFLPQILQTDEYKPQTTAQELLSRALFFGESLDSALSQFDNMASASFMHIARVVHRGNWLHHVIVATTDPRSTIRITGNNYETGRRAEHVSSIEQIGRISIGIQQVQHNDLLIMSTTVPTYTDSNFRDLELITGEHTAQDSAELTGKLSQIGLPNRHNVVLSAHIFQM